MTSFAQRSSKLKSQIREVLMLLAAADPDLKVRKLIQDLIEKRWLEAAQHLAGGLSTSPEGS